ncbi:MAG: ribonuclease P protein component [Muribaculaceae bacterium]|nr:ribonuclease P protein component [Muribaculaceae bacterium]
MDKETENTLQTPPATANAQRLTLRKGEKLRHKALIDTLFSEGKTLYSYPLRVTWRTLSPERLSGSFRAKIPNAIGSLQMMITVPKKRRRHAVDRVLMRRRIREAYRLNRLPLKHLVEDNHEIRTLSLIFIYIGDKNEDSQLVNKKMRKLLDKIAETVRYSSSLK